MNGVERGNIINDPERAIKAWKEDLGVHLEGWKSDLTLAQKGRYPNGQRMSSAGRRLMATRALKEIRDIERDLE